jgi:hypothetical protein
VRQDFTAAVENDGADPQRLAAIDLLEEWDGRFVTGACGWASGTDRADAWVIMDAWIKESSAHFRGRAHLPRGDAIEQHYRRNKR